MSGAYYVDRFPSLRRRLRVHRRRHYRSATRLRSVEETWARSATAPDRSPRASRRPRVIRGIHPTPLVTIGALVEFSEAVRYERLICPRVRSDPSQDCL
ncbi:hypothetical protein EVAR_90628_1 [Eumeta japonica]|uniref:Uncharacterized protein n=1 Tax=Eumeta variegata TaxID=151549 RepID=A0A4C1ZVC9_EUMVA|nr:hypothetical protein EVAR_90628_1 [Eumeta japonica]